MIELLAELELRLLHDLSRDELIDTLVLRLDCLPLRFARAWLADQPTNHLQFLLLAARLTHMVRQQERRTRLAGCCWEAEAPSPELHHALDREHHWVDGGNTVMHASLAAVDVCQLDNWSRQQLIATLLDVSDCLALTYTADWLNEQRTDRLRVLLLAAKLFCMVQQERRA